MKNTERSAFYKKFLPMLIIFLLPFAVIISAVFLLPDYYSDTFLGELSEKYRLLSDTDEPKITVVGGSSVAFGLDSGLIEEKLGMKAVNFGLYANLGTKMMMDLARENINPGDIIVLAPELNGDTYSLFFNAETAAQSLDGGFSMIKRIEPSDRALLAGAMWQTAANKLGYALSGSRPENTGAYRKENFNENGDNVYDRPYNVMTGYGNPVTLSFSDTPEFEEYLNFVNEFTEYAEKRGAKVFFSFPPINRAAIEPFETRDGILDFYKNLQNRLDCKIISDIFNYIMDEGYFYDSEFHLNNAGVTVRTVKLIDDIKRELGDSEITLSDLPSPPGRRPDCEDFDLVRLENSRGWAICSVSETGLKKSALKIPDEVGGIPVTAIETGAFDGSRAALLELGKNIMTIEPAAFDGAKMLSAVLFPENSDPSALNLPAGIGDGCAEGFRLYVPPQDLEGFVNTDNLKHIKDLFAPDESFEYLISDGEAKIIGLTETGKTRSELTVPDEHDGVKITSVGGFALDGAEVLKIIRLGKNIRALEENAFSGVPGELEIRLPEGAAGKITLPENPADLGMNVKIYTYSKDYEKMSANYPQYGGVLTADNLYFELEESDGGWIIVGLNERGKAQILLTVPDEVDGLAVRTVAAEAFSGSNAERIELGAAVSRLDGRALSGSSAKELVIPLGRGPEDISAPNCMSEALATDGASPELKIIVDPELYEAFISDYFWGDYGGRIEKAGE